MEIKKFKKGLVYSFDYLNKIFKVDKEFVRYETNIGDRNLLNIKHKNMNTGIKNYLYEKH